jgi:ABC-type Fe2+-enterobactin transport system substrate-binding protein
MSATAPDKPAMRGVVRWFDTRFRSAAAIYGLIVYAAFITISSDHAADPWDMLDTAAWTLVVFYIAHVFAHTLTDHGEHGFAKAAGQAMRHAAGMLYAAVPATIVLIVCGVQGVSVEAAYVASMWATTAVLAVLGYVAYWRRGAHPVIRLVGAAGTAALGLIIILLEYAIH